MLDQTGRICSNAGVTYRRKAVRMREQRRDSQEAYRRSARRLDTEQLRGDLTGTRELSDRLTDAAVGLVDTRIGAVEGVERRVGRHRQVLHVRVDRIGHH